MIYYQCKICDKKFNQKCHYINHTEKRKKPCLKQESNNDSLIIKKNDLIQNPPINIILPLNNENIDNETIHNETEIKCKYCFNTFSRNPNLNKHLKNSCKVKKQQDEKQEDYKKQLDDKNAIIAKQQLNIEQLNERINSLAEQTLKLHEQITGLAIKQIPKNSELQKINNNINKLTETLPISSSNLINAHLINTIIKKDKTIEQLDKANKKEVNKINSDLCDDLDINSSCSSISSKDNIIIKTCMIDNLPIEFASFYESELIYINATKLCELKKKKFSEWFYLDPTQKALSTIEKKINKPLIIDFDENKITEKNINYKINDNIWVYSDLAICLSYWIDFDFFVEFNLCIKKLTIDNKNNLIKKQQKRIKLLEDINLKRQKRKLYEPNILYLVTCDELLENNKYLIGKSKNLTNRLSGYEKMSDFNIVYQKSFNTLKQCEMGEKIVLDALEDYKEKLCRDRFILPVGDDIKIFTDIFDSTYTFLNK